VILASAALALLLAAPAAQPAAAQAHPFNVQDMLSLDRVADPRVSPDGKWVAFTVSVTDLDANKRRADVWLAPVEGGQPRRLTTHEASDSSPRWMPDGKSLVFLSSRSGSSQVWRIALDGGEPTQLTKLPVDVSTVTPFPDGKRLLLSMDVYPDAPVATALEETARRDAAAAKAPVKAKAYESLLFRHWDAWDDGKRSHVFTLTLGESVPVDLMAGMNADSPVRPHGGAGQLAISPDGKEVVFAARARTSDAAWTTDINLYAVPSTGGAPKLLTAENKALDDSPSYSPDGKLLAYVAMSRPGFEADRLRLTLMDRATGGRRVLAEGWDRSVSDFTWSADGKTLYVTADNVGNHSLFAIDVASGKVTTLVQDGYQTSPAVAGKRLVFARDTLVSPVELYSAKPDGTDLKAITALNAEKLAGMKFGAFEQFSFPGAKGEKVHGYVVKPADFAPGRKYPVAMLIHGGPQGSFGNHFHYRWNPQVYAGAGYAAIFIDFHGSTGYGQAFTDAISGDWGGAPFEDLMKGLDFALAKYPFLDGGRVAALGASYGGYMINWIAGHTDRFKALVNHDGLFDTRAAYYSTEELWFPEWEFKSTPWQNPDSYAKHNPADFVQNWKTPMLVIHGGQDFRVVDTNGLSAFTALQRKGVPSRLLYFPEENHWVLRPQNSVRWHQEVLGWLDRWTKPAAANVAADSVR
jgi:dipeptidyl aminopeptidase/acylaminoacyl peptidase